MGDGDGSQAVPEVCTVPFGHQSCLPAPVDPVKLAPDISHTPALTGTGDTPFLPAALNKALPSTDVRLTFSNPAVTPETCSAHLKPPCCSSPAWQLHSPLLFTWGTSTHRNHLLISSVSQPASCGRTQPVLSCPSSSHGRTQPLLSLPSQPPPRMLQVSHHHPHCPPRRFCPLARLEMILFPSPSPLSFSAAALPFV